MEETRGRVLLGKRCGPVMSCQVLSDFAFGGMLAILAVVVQGGLNFLLARDSYQLVLAAVTISAIRGGTGNGAAALFVAIVGRIVFYFIPSYPGHGQTGLFLAWMTSFILVGSILCSLGGAVYAALKRQDRTLSRARLLSGLLPICSCCKRIMDEHGRWCDLECFISTRSDAEFSHAFCPRCAAQAVSEEEAVG